MHKEQKCLLATVRMMYKYRNM